MESRSVKKSKAVRYEEDDYYDDDGENNVIVNGDDDDDDDENGNNDYNNNGNDDDDVDDAAPVEAGVNVPYNELVSDFGGAPYWNIKAECTRRFRRDLKNVELITLEMLEVLWCKGGRYTFLYHNYEGNHIMMISPNHNNKQILSIVLNFA